MSVLKVKMKHSFTELSPPTGFSSHLLSAASTETQAQHRHGPQTHEQDCSVPVCSTAGGCSLAGAEEPSL